MFPYKKKKKISGLHGLWNPECLSPILERLCGFHNILFSSLSEIWGITSLLNILKHAYLYNKINNYVAAHRYKSCYISQVVDAKLRKLSFIICVYIVYYLEVAIVGVDLALCVYTREYVLKCLVVLGEPYLVSDGDSTGESAVSKGKSEAK